MRLLVIVAFTLVLSPSLYGQGAPPQIDKSNLEQRVDSLAVRLDKIETLLTELVNSRESGAAGGLTDDDLTTEEDSKAFQRMVQTRLQALEDRLSQIAELGGTGGSADISGILSVMEKDPIVRQDFFKATNGRFEVHNDMNKPMSVRINGQHWQFPSGISSIHIPFGVVQIQLVDGGDRHTFDHHDWQFVNREHLLKMRITTQLPRQE